MKKIMSKFIAALMVLTLIPTVAFAVPAGAELQTESTTDKTVYAKGETAHFSITVSQTAEGTQAEGVNISQKLVENAADMQVSNISATLNGEPEEISPEMDLDNNGFMLDTGFTLATGDELKITFDVTITDSVTESVPIISRVLAYATNVESEKMSYSAISVGELPEGAIKVTNAADREDFTQGQAVQYTITAEQTTEGALAEGVVIKNSFTPQNAHVETNTMSVKMGTTDITEWCDITYDSNDEDSITGFTIDTNSYLTSTDPITVTYYAYMLTNGQVASNATVEAVGYEPVADGTTIGSVSGEPYLAITKESNKDSYETGEIASYSIAVGNTGDATAKNVEISDEMTGGKVNTDTIAVYDAKTMSNITSDCTINGTNISVGDMEAGDIVLVNYNAEITATSGEIANVATASIDGAPEAEYNSTKHIVGYTNADGFTIMKESSSDTYEAGDIMDYTVSFSSEEMINDTIHITDSFNTDMEASDVRVYEIVGEQEYEISNNADLEYTNSGFVMDLNYTLGEDSVIEVRYNVEMGEADSYTNTADIEVGDIEATAKNTVELSRESGGSGDGPQTGDILIGLVALMAIAGAGYAVARKTGKQE